MTESEAIESLVYLKEELEDDSPDMFTYTTGNVEALEVSIKVLEEIQKYREIGTVEEFREAMEKQGAKKYKKIQPCKSVNYYQCPCCNGLLHMNENFCGDCGQAISWEDEECLT